MSEERIGFMKVGALGLVLCGGWNLWPSNDLKPSQPSHEQVAKYEDFPKVKETPKELEVKKEQENKNDIDVKFSVTARQFARDWSNNEVKAAKKYSEPFLLTAKISKILDQAHVILYVQTNTGMPIAISLEDSQNDQAADLNPGDKITVVCQNAGNEILATFANNCLFVTLDD